MPRLSKWLIMVGGVSREFKLVALNAGLSRLGTSAFDLMILWVVLKLTRSPVLSGFGEGILSIPLFLSFALGAVIDRSERKKGLAIAAASLRSAALAGLVLAALSASKLIILMAIYLAAFVIGLTSDLLNSVRAAWIKEFLTEDQYKTGSGISNAAESIADAGGYAISGALLSLGYVPAFLALAVIFLASIPPLMSIAEEGVPVKDSSWSSLKEGAHFIASNKALVEAMGIALITNMVFGMSGVVFAALVQLSFGLPAYFMSALIVCIMAGVGLGSMLGSKVKGRLTYIGGISMLLSGLSVVIMAFTPSVYLDFFPSIVAGICIGVLNAAFMAAFLKIIPFEMMARAQGAFNTFALAATFLSGTVGGVLIAALTVKWAIVFIGGMAALSSMLWLSFRELGQIRV